MHPCPCCGYRTLAQRADYDLCPVCCWEDDGGEPWAHSGPNAETLVEAQQRYLAQRLPHRLRPGRVRAPRRGEERDPGWQPFEVTDELLARVKQAHDDVDRAIEAAAEGMDEQVDEHLQEYNEARRLLDAEAASLPHSEVRSRLHELGEAYGFKLSSAHLELFARLMKNENYYRGHPLRTAWWLLRYSSPRTLGRRRTEVRTGTVHFVG